MGRILWHLISLNSPPLSVLSVQARPKLHDRRPPFLQSRTRTDGNWDPGLVKHSDRYMSDMTRKLDRMWSTVRFSIYHRTLHPLNLEVEASNVVRVQRYHRDKWCKDCAMALCGRWDKEDSLLYDGRSIRQFDGYFPQTQSNLEAALAPLEMK